MLLMDTASQSLHKLLHHVVSVYAREVDQILLEQFGLGFSQYKILNSIQENMALRQKHIAFELGQTEASVSRQVHLLESSGMLSVRINPANKREHAITITPKGERLMSAAQEVLARYQDSVVRHLSPKQQTQLIDLLATIYR